MLAEIIQAAVRRPSIRRLSIFAVVRRSLVVRGSEDLHRPGSAISTMVDIRVSTCGFALVWLQVARFGARVNLSVDIGTKNSTNTHCVYGITLRTLMVNTYRST